MESSYEMHQKTHTVMWTEVLQGRSSLWHISRLATECIEGMGTKVKKGVLCQMYPVSHYHKEPHDTIPFLN